MADSSVTRRVCSLGARDQYTGHSGYTFTEETVDAVILHQGESISPTNSTPGIYCRYPHGAWVPDVIHEDDELVNAQGDYFRVLSTKERWWQNQFDGYECSCQKIKEAHHVDRPATSGTWHEDSDSNVTDIRYRTKAWLDAYLEDVHRDNGISEAVAVVMFAKPDYHLWREFWDKAVAVICYVEHANSKALTTYNHYPYAFDESVTIRICAVNKADITATRLVEEMEQAIRKVATDYPIGSIREITATSVQDEDLGGYTLYGKTITLRYKRANPDYAPSYPRITWGPSAAPTGTYYFPNVTNLRYPSDEEIDVWLKPFGYTTAINQASGDPPLNIELTCDLDVDNTTYTWKRPQTSMLKTDTVNHEVFWENKHQEGIDQAYHTLTLSANGPALKVRMVKKPDVNDNVLTLLFREYTTASASGGTVQTRYALT